jgi:predicted outer membrane repeat protein
MRIFTFIILFLINGSALSASSGGAIYSEEITAEWESSSESVIQGDRILSDLRSNKDTVLKINALCSYEYIKQISELRRMAVSVIIRSQESGVFSGDSYLAGVLLQNIGELSFKPLSIFEQRLVLESEKVFLSSGTFQGRDL